MEVDGVARRWMHGLAIPVHKIYVNINIVLLKKKRASKEVSSFFFFKYF